MQVLGGQGGYFQKLSYGSETWDMTCEVLGEMFEGDFVDMCAEIFSLVSIGGWVEGQACEDPGARTPMGGSRNYSTFVKFMTELWSDDKSKVRRKYLSTLYFIIQQK